MRRGNIRISTEVNVQQGCLCTLEHNGLSCLVCLIGQNGNVVHILCQTLAVFGILCNHCVQIKRLAAVNSSNDLVLQCAGSPCLFCENFRMYQIIDPQTAAFVLVHVSRTDATLGGADVRVAAELFRQTVQLNVPRHYHVCTGIDLQVCGRNAAAFQTVQFRDEVLRVQNHAGTDQAQGFRIENTGRDQVQLVHFAVVDNGVTGIVAACCTNHHICTRCHDVDDLTLSFVSPL